MMMKDWIEFLEQAKACATEQIADAEKRMNAGHAVGDWDEETYFGGRRAEARFWAGYFAARLHAATLYPGIRISRDGETVAEFVDISLARMALVMFQSNEEANGNAAHTWKLETGKS